MSRRLKNKPANITCDEEFLKEFPYFNRTIQVNETDKIKRWRMRKRKNKESIDEIGQGLLIKQKKRKKLQQKKWQIVLPEIEPKRKKEKQK